MAVLRPSAIKQVLDKLGATPFGVVGFDVKFPESGDSLATIVFAAKKSLILSIISVGSLNNPLSVRMSPGEYRSEDQVRLDTFKDCLSCIQPWARRIHDDLRTQDPNLEELQAFRDSLEEHIKGSVKNEGAKFSQEEVTELSEKLDTLAARIKEMEDQHALTQKEVKYLR